MPRGPALPGRLHFMHLFAVIGLAGLLIHRDILLRRQVRRVSFARFTTGR
jgi:hypothetical protein